MKIEIIICLILILIAAPQVAGAANSSQNKIDKLLGKKFPSQKEISRQIIKFEKGKSPFTDKPVILRTITTPGSRSYTVNGEVWGKSVPVEFIALFNSKGAITEVIVIRSPGLYGTRIKKKRWLKQFQGHITSETIIHGKTVDSISGATISAKALIKGIKRSINIVKREIRIKHNP